MKILDKYIISNFIKTFVFIILLLSLIAVVIDISQKLEDFIDNKAPISKIIFDYYVSFIPYINGLLAPLFIFIAVIFFTSRLANRSEIISILANGVSFKRFLLPYLICGIGLAAFMWLSNNYIIPTLRKRGVKFEEQYVLNAFQNKERNIHFQISPSKYIYVESFNASDTIGYKFSLEEFDKKKNLIYKLRGDRIEWDKKEKKWIAFRCTERFFVNTVETLESKPYKYIEEDFYPKDFTTGRLYKETMTTNELCEYIHKERKRGANKLELYELEAYARSALAYSILIFTMIGVSVSYRKVRGGMGLNLVIGFIISGLYVVVQQFSKTFTTNAGLDAMWGVWIPNILFTIVAIVLLIKSSKD